MLQLSKADAIGNDFSGMSKECREATSETKVGLCKMQKAQEAQQAPLAARGLEAKNVEVREATRSENLWTMARGK